MDSKTKQYKQTHFDKIKATAEEIECECGCGERLLNKDDYGRTRNFISGHNRRRRNDGQTAKQRYYAINKIEAKARARVAKTPRARRIKGELVVLKGGKCLHCSITYDGNNACIFQFHHQNPAEKLFNITTGTISNKNMKDILKEVEKCVLLCANCHALHHGGGY